MMPTFNRKFLNPSITTQKQIKIISQHIIVDFHFHNLPLICATVMNLKENNKKYTINSINAALIKTVSYDNDKRIFNLSSECVCTFN